MLLGRTLVKVLLSWKDLKVLASRICTLVTLDRFRTKMNQTSFIELCFINL